MDEDDIDLEELESVNSNSWVRIGILKEIRIYPLDTGYGFKVCRAVCTKNGLQSFSLNETLPGYEEKFRYTDRTFVTYQQNQEALLNNFLLAAFNSTATFHHMQKQANMPDGLWPSKVDYFGNEIKVRDIGFEVVHPTAGKIGEIGFISQEERRKFIYQSKANVKNRGNLNFLSNYYPYTLINHTSLDALKKENEDCRDISIENFRPQLVIEANLPYCEDDIMDLKIGNNACFTNVVPCTHLFLEHDHVMRQTKYRKLFDIMKKIRPLNKLHPYLSESSEMPVFGINLEVCQPGVINLDDDIFAKFRDIPIDLNEIGDSDDDMEIDDETMKQTS